MAEVIGIASGLLTLVNTTIRSCKTLYRFVNDFKEASAHMRMILSDLQDLENVLQTLEALLKDDDLAHGVISPASSLNLEDVLYRCDLVLKETDAQLKELQQERSKAIQEEIQSLRQQHQKEQKQERLKEIDSRLQELQIEEKHRRSKAWNRLKWTFKKDVWEDLRERLAQCKLTLNLVISVANLWVFRCYWSTKKAVDIFIGITYVLLAPKSLLCVSRLNI